MSRPNPHQQPMEVVGSRVNPLVACVAGAPEVQEGVTAVGLEAVGLEAAGLEAAGLARPKLRLALRTRGNHPLIPLSMKFPAGNAFPPVSRM